ncbi:putative DNA-3-methyladenine glycosylase [Candidatus Glomeribacter gigasporarum BEG34]|uniref:DNA-3-methyladenine glycosylase II n=2 Tax=Candidatus Glomeribacter gigasporarum TaxID=132144 RepID=G2J9L9_9BURK|nr:DNA-3-methyladenine glycosylase [Candidatus Glomeribacter gigasporarum]CCD29466.1 putative DNA-3-methyladenine glycosylase [Candidatus Glomeribacter gigasporarum BEG34]
MTRLQRGHHSFLAAIPVAARAPKTAPAGAPPAYWAQACAELSESDRILKKLIPLFEPAAAHQRRDPFITLARAIVGQQISVKAAHAIWMRIERAYPALTPAQLAQCEHDSLLRCGLSKRKTEYILDLAHHFSTRAVQADAWEALDDEAIIASLMRIRGIGRWTAEMFLIFNLMRPDVLPLDDLGLLRAISLNYFSGEPVSRSEAREVAANWQPWRSVAVWYLWRSLDPIPVNY